MYIEVLIQFSMASNTLKWIFVFKKKLKIKVL